MASKSWNKVELIGNLTRDPELRFTPSGAAVCTFSIATNRTYTSSDGEKKEEADFHRCVAWNKLAELCNQLLKKGMRVFVSGRLQNRSWQGTDGATKYMTEVVLEDMIILTPRSDSSYSEGTKVEPTSAKVLDEPVLADSSQDGSKEKPGKDEKAPLEEISPDDLPF
jgi:single-strand DNA-binding protein